MRILGIDPGLTNMAICLLDEENFKTFKLKSSEHVSHAYRLFDLEQQLDSFITDDIDLVVHEGLAFAAKFGVAESGMVQYVIQRCAIVNAVQFITVAPASLRRFLGIKTVKGQNNKTVLTMAVYKKYKLEFPSQDECDAFILAQIGMSVLKKEFELIAPKKPAKKK